MCVKWRGCVGGFDSVSRENSTAQRELKKPPTERYFYKAILFFFNEAQVILDLNERKRVRWCLCRAGVNFCAGHVTGGGPRDHNKQLGAEETRCVCDGRGLSCFLQKLWLICLRVAFRLLLARISLNGKLINTIMFFFVHWQQQQHSRHALW